MSRRTRWHNGREYDDPRGYTHEPRSWWEEDPLLRAKPWRDLALFWKYLIYLAVWEHEGREVWYDGDSAPLLVQRGQLYMPLEKLGEKPQWGKTRVWRALQKLERDGRIVTEGRSAGTLITIVNYGTYQDPEFYCETPQPVNLDKSSKKRNGGQAEKRNASKARTASGVRPSQRGGGVTHIGAVCETVTERRRNANRYKKLKKENTPAAESDVDNSVDNAPAAAGVPGPCTWETIQTVVRNDLWSHLADDAKPAIIEEAAQAGPPPDDLDPHVRAFLARELERLGFDLDYLEHVCCEVE